MNNKIINPFIHSLSYNVVVIFRQCKSVVLTITKLLLTREYIYIRAIYCNKYYNLLQ